MSRAMCTAVVRVLPTGMNCVDISSTFWIQASKTFHSHVLTQSTSWRHVAVVPSTLYVHRFLNLDRVDSTVCSQHSPNNLNAEEQTGAL